MAGYAQFCPLAKASEIVARPWTPLVLRELVCGSRRFNAIHRGVPRMSRSLLVQRLGELGDAGLVERRLVGDRDHPEYHLTEAGRALAPVLVELGAWGKQWLESELDRDDLDAGVLMWDVQRRIVREELPARRVVVGFRFPDAPPRQRRFWLVLEPDAVDLCLEDPGHDEDLVLRSDVATFTRVWLGDETLARVLELGRVKLSGPADLRRRLPSWLGLSLFAGHPRRR